MSRIVKRKIIVEEKCYYWTLNGNSIDDKEKHIKIHTNKSTKSILYLDPYNWNFEIRPNTIRKAILFAIKNGWKPEENTDKMYISFNEKGFYILPKGMAFGHENDTKSKE